MLSVIRKYKVNRKNKSDFELEYGIHGTWRNFFSESCDYKGSRLLKSKNEADTYVLIDNWIDEPSYEYFKNVHHERYRQLCEKFRPLYLAEQKVGRFSYIE